MTVVRGRGRWSFPSPLTLVPMLHFEAGDEIVDLTCESLEPVVVDLTHNDSVVVSGAWGLAWARPWAPSQHRRLEAWVTGSC